MAVKEIQDVCGILTSDSSDCDDKLQALRDLKKQFKPLDSVYSRLKLESLLQRARVSFERKPSDKTFLYNYGNFLLSIISLRTTFDSEILYQLEYILTELNDQDESLTDLLVTKLWSQMESGSIFQSDKILNSSKKIIERIVLDWVDTTGDPPVEFLSKIVSDSPKLFQTVTLVLYEVLVETCFHRKVLDVQKTFVICVKRMCLKKGKNFLGLYPKGCCQLVSLLMVPPKVFAEARVDVISDVVSLFLEMFLPNKKTALILLSHFPEWINIFSLSFFLETHCIM